MRLLSSTALPPVVIFDLDRTLYDTDSAQDAVKQAIEEFTKQFETLFGEASVIRRADLVQQLIKMSPDEVIEFFHLDQKNALLYIDFYENLPVPAEAVLYLDVWGALEKLQTKGVRLFLVTKGEESFQRRKISHVGIERFFKEMVVVGPRCKIKDKKTAFQDLMTRHYLSPHTIWVVGDGQEELTAGRILGWRTVQTLRPGVPKREADHHIRTLPELVTLMGVE